MNFLPDFKDFLKLLETHPVDDMIVGGYAVAFHGFDERGDGTYLAAAGGRAASGAGAGDGGS